ncbi:hypothetical protein F4777DRAFT_599794 [Nemania sp. FL0916]|nr:hypothetical protein F4777DRAFT_599794 [Nemania sp. FL0916]
MHKVVIITSATIAVLICERLDSISSKSFAIVAGAGIGMVHKVTSAVALLFAKTYLVVLPNSAEAQVLLGYGVLRTVSGIIQSGGKAMGASANVVDDESIGTAFDAIQKTFISFKLAAVILNVTSGYMIKLFLEQNSEGLEISFSDSA